MTVTRQEVQSAIRRLGLAARAVCVHSSLRSFGHLEGGAESIIAAFLDEQSTLLVPTFSSVYATAPPPDLPRPARNGWNYEAPPHASATAPAGRVFSTAASEIDADMGAVPAAVLNHPHRARGRHPLNSFSAVGPLAEQLVAGQTPDNVYAPLRALADHGGGVLLMGVGLERMTLLHLAEEEAGRKLFVRWATGVAAADGRPVCVAVGGCSEGFGRLAPALDELAQSVTVGPSRWRLFPAAATVRRAAAEIRSNPSITHCGAPSCERCPDAVAGGPVPA